jgi:hypothetical protein
MYVNFILNDRNISRSRHGCKCLSYSLDLASVIVIADMEAIFHTTYVGKFVFTHTLRWGETVTVPNLLTVEIYIYTRGTQK